MSVTPLVYLLEQLGSKLLAHRMMVVVAESCTGGGIARALTSLPGSSSWFERGFVTYSNASKQELLGVSADTLATSGAVSEETAMEMAEGALHNSHAGISVAVTGIAGPDGGTEDKPVGMVCFAWSVSGGETITATTVFSGDREEVREQAVLMAVQGLLDRLEKQ
ncbi:MAG: CinA family protein [Gammaproteobacteria bacterium]